MMSRFTECSWRRTSTTAVSEYIRNIVGILCAFINNNIRKTIGTPKVFTGFKETLSALKCNKTARFKVFKSATEAERFSIFGQESPVKQIEKDTSNVSTTSFSFKSLKSDELVAFRRLIEGGELSKVKQAVQSNPRFLVSSGDTPAIIQVTLSTTNHLNVL